MRIVTGAQMAEIDRRTIEEIGITAEALMENAGWQVAQAARELLESRGFALGGGPAGRPGPRVVVVAGRGNNGGDGCVAARYLANLGARVRVYIPAPPTRRSEGEGQGGKSAAARQLEVLERLGIDVHPVVAADLSKVKLNLAMADLVIDALMGTGFQGEPQGLMASLIDAINEAGAPVVAVDIPSGVASGTGQVQRGVWAHTTVTFGLPKVGNILFPGAEYCGNLKVVDIGFPRKVLDEGADLWWLQGGYVRGLLPPRPKDSHKGTFGHVAVVAGSRGMVGAGQLAVRGAHRGGAGLVTWVLPASMQAGVAGQMPETLTTGAPEHAEGGLAEGTVGVVESLIGRGVRALVVGPGLGRAAETVATVRRLVGAATVPTVIDADGLNALAGWEGAIGARRAAGAAEWVLTPHPGEMARLAGKPVAEVVADPVGVARQVAERFQAVVVLKGVRTVIAHRDGRAWVNSTGNPALAAGGTGDVLAGAIGALIAQGCPPLAAALAGVYMHGLAGDLAAAEMGAAGVLAREVADRLPLARKEILTAGGAGEGRAGPGAS